MSQVEPPADREPSALVSQGVLAYLHADSAASPRADEAAVAALAEAGGDSARLVEQVKAIVAESVQISVDWNAVSLGEAGRQVAAEMRSRHPELSQDAADALAWNFTFAWR